MVAASATAILFDIDLLSAFASSAPTGAFKFAQHVQNAGCRHMFNRAH
jgi:hypothetical protein